jgi:hypothetical protein
MEPLDAMGRPAEAEPAGAALPGGRTAAGLPAGRALASTSIEAEGLAGEAAVGDGADDGGGVGLAQPTTRIATMTRGTLPRCDLIGQRYASHLPSDAARPGVEVQMAGPRRWRAVLSGLDG